MRLLSTGYGIHESRYATEDPILSAVCEVCGIIESVARRSDTIVIHRVTASGHWSQSAAATSHAQLATFKCLIQGSSFRSTAMTDTTTSPLETINNNASEETWRMRNRGQQTYKMIPNIVNTATVDDWRVMMVDQLSLISWLGHPSSPGQILFPSYLSKKMFKIVILSCSCQAEPRRDALKLHYLYFTIRNKTNLK